MKLLSKYKYFSRNIKLLIIGALIMSCFVVYAAGECIISTTASEVSYNGTTLQAAIDDLYDLANTNCPNGYICSKNHSVTDCDNKQIYTTTPSRLSGLAKIIAQDAYLDNGQSEYVSSCNGVNFDNISSDTNGKGIYEIASTKNDEYPIYYYRGAVNNNNVLFAGFCWKIVRTTDTGGVKMIYNGTKSFWHAHACTNTTGTSTHIGNTKFNSNNDSPAYVGYMYGDVYPYYNRTASNLSTPYVYGGDVTYSNGTYTLTNTMTSTGDWETDYTTLNNNHYTCFSTGTTCTNVYYIYSTDTDKAYYLTLSNGKKLNDALNDMFTNTTNSLAKTQVDTWYSNNMTSYTSYIEDTVYCNSRTAGAPNGWNPDGGDGSREYGLYFNSGGPWNSGQTPNLLCKREADKFTVSPSIGNGKLTYPVGLITNNEIWFAGGRGGSANSTYYLYNNADTWSMSPNDVITHSGITNEFEIYANGAISGDYGSVINNAAIRPVITLSPNATIISTGDGTPTNPYIVQTN